MKTAYAHQKILLYVGLLFCCFNLRAQEPFVTVKGHQFMIQGEPYHFIGANYWYGGLLALNEDPVRGKERLIHELDFLKSQGVTNLRVLVGAEGTGKINGVDRVSPALQKEKSVFNKEVLESLDFLLMEMNKRKMYAVLYLSNNWEWSGGFMQYLHWNGQMDTETLQRKLSWDEQRDYTSRFYSCEPCQTGYRKQLDYIFRHKSIYTGKTYSEEPAIMAWELANEPRPMRPQAIEAYKKWISSTAGYIRSKDKNHLITIGTEGVMGTEENKDLFTKIHADPSVDYLTIHIWPKNWGWFKDSPTKENLPLLMERTTEYIRSHEAIAQKLNKPLVIEEFGLPRDHHTFSPSGSTSIRDDYFRHIFSICMDSRKTSGPIAGCNFWAFGGSSRPIEGQLFWKEGDDFSGDPPQEEQGLNTVFDSDHSTWDVIRESLAVQRINPYKVRVDSLLAIMTLEEKVGQMTQITLGVVGTQKDGEINPDALKTALLNYKVGSILNVTNHALSVEQWHSILTKIADEAKNTRLKIPVLYGLDGIHGQTYTLESTLFPQNLAMAATRNLELAKSITKVAAKELRASGVRWNFATVLDCGRQPLWSRFPETYGEDVFIGKTMGAAVIRAYEEDGLDQPTAVASCMKHFLGYSASRSGKDRTPIYLPEIEMREYYLPQFSAAVKAGASSVMINSSIVNGMPLHSNKYLLTDVLRKELGFDGVAVSDWEDIKRVHAWHHVAATPRAAVAMCVNAGVDMSMVPYDYSFYDLLIEAVKLKEVSMERIDEAVGRILTLKMKLGLFENPYPEATAKANFGRPEYQELALEAARESMTLLKNQNDILPLSKQKKYLVLGPGAQSISTLNGCWSYTWQGKEEQWYPKDSRTILQAIADKAGKENVLTTTARGFESPENFDTRKLAQAAKGVDAIILCLGENAYAESPGNIGDLALDENQQLLAKAAAGLGKPVILVLTEGRPRFITNIEPKTSAILMAYWSGRKTAEAIADVLFGDYNPNGRLPFSYPRSSGEVVLYDRKPIEDVREVFNNDIHTGYDPLFPFGAGLSYTDFVYSDLKISTNKLLSNDKLQVSVVVSNKGRRDGKHTVELYTRDMFASVSPDVKRLRAFQKIELKAGESKVVSFTIDKNDLAFVNHALQTVTEAGDFKVMIGTLTADFAYE